MRIRTHLSNPIQKLRVRWREERFVRRMLALQKSGAGYEAVWAHPGTPSTEIIAWCDTLIGKLPRTIDVPTLDLIRIAVVHCTPEQEAQEAAGIPALRDIDHLITWTGSRVDWWNRGRDRIQSAIPADHQGLYIGMNSLSAAFQQAQTLSANQL